MSPRFRESGGQKDKNVARKAETYVEALRDSVDSKLLKS
jgi:hypothetical protein